MKFTIKHFKAQFKTDRDCLHFIFQTRYPDGGTCEKCGHKDCFHPVTNRRSYACAWCGFQVYPTEGTIFHKSPTSLLSWFFAIFLLTASKNGVAAKELERQLGVTYKTAWRMAHQIRKLMRGPEAPLSGIVEADETYLGGVRPGKRGRGAANKTPVLGLVERGGNVHAEIVPDVKAKTLMPAIAKNVAAGATLCTDELGSYNQAASAGYTHHRVCHSLDQYVCGIAHTNTIDGFWSQLKRSIHGTFHHISRQHSAKYVNEFVYRYNLRKSETPIFQSLTERVAERHVPKEKRTPSDPSLS